MSRSKPSDRAAPGLPRRAAPLLCALLLAAPACNRAPSEAPLADGPPENVYTVRGRIVGLPSPQHPGSGLQVQHEAIPDYVNPKGEAVGMKAMAMPFTPAPGLDLGGLSVGDPVEFTWEVRWAPPRFARVTRIHKLPPDIELQFKTP